jgi:hypothetical protein
MVAVVAYFKVSSNILLKNWVKSWNPRRQYTRPDDRDLKQACHLQTWHLVNVIFVDLMQLGTYTYKQTKVILETHYF